MALIASAASAQVVRGGALPAPLPLFPADNWWNVDVSGAPIDSNSTNFINFVGAGHGLHPDFGGDVDPGNPASNDIYGFPYVVVSGTQPLVPVTFVESDDQSDHGAPGRPPGYPIPVEAQTQGKWIEGGAPGGGDGNDDHFLIVDRDRRILYELYHANWNVDHWEAGSGAIFAFDSDARRPDTWTSADAAGLAILPGLVRYDEAFGSVPIRHAFRCTVRSTNGYVYPASHDAGGTAGALPMGARLRLKASTDLSGYTPEVQRIFQAMKTYGLIVADNGADLYVQGTYDTRWNNDVLNPAFSLLHGSDFEVVQLGWQPPVGTSAGPLDFYTVTPCRVIDTRNASGPYGAPSLPPGSQRVIVVSGRCGIPPTAKAVSANLTVAAAAGAGFLTFFPGNAAGSSTSTINFKAGQTRANNAVLMLASSGTGTVAVQSGAAAAIDVILDVNGYFQ
ncbi:MAG TPA: hypothetical protein VOA87_03935 [Thermoanaerobaculia bacterium]|nr:hypothetical protein [Thermoanaerobaculia bacterium]